MIIRNYVTLVQTNKILLPIPNQLTYITEHKGLTICYMFDELTYIRARMT